MRSLAFFCMAAAVLLAGCSGAAGNKPLDFRETITDAKGKVFPSVVYIKVLKETHQQGKKATSEVSGSGVLISADGELLTNWHVVDKALEVRCLLFGGTAYDAEVLGTDKEMDLALLKLEIKDEAAKNLPFATLGDSSLLKEGDFVMAMGAPWGLSRSVSMGRISCTRRYLPKASEYSIWLQTDAAISPGNSGGPLINTAGEIIGINTRGAMVGGDMGFSIPSNSIKLFLPQLREYGEIKWSYNGLQLQPLKDFDKNIYFEATRGVIVAGTDPGSPSRRAGIQMRDRILSVNGTPLHGLVTEDLPQIRRQLGSLAIDQPAEFKIVREDKELTITLSPRQKGKVEGEELDCPRWDMTIKTINQFDNPDLYFYKKEGVFVFGIERPGNASNARFSQKDILLKIGSNKIVTLDDVQEAYDQAMEQIADNSKIVFSILRNGLMRQVVLDFSRDYEKQ